MLKEIVTQKGIHQFGVASFAQCLPLLPCRAASRIPAGAQSVIVCLLPYYIGEYPDRNVSRYALADDYHTIGRQILEEIAAQLQEAYPQGNFACFVDSSPIREVHAGYLAGLGVIGWNGQLINSQYGSYAFIGEIVTDVYFPPSQPQKGSCLECGACIRACPGQALGRDGQLDLSRCRSQITQKKGELAPWEEEAIRQGGMVWGCDRCTDVCPMNRGAKPSDIPAFYENVTAVVDRENLSMLLKTKAFGYRGRKVLERNLNILEGKETKSQETIDRPDGESQLPAKGLPAGEGKLPLGQRREK